MSLATALPPASAPAVDESSRPAAGTPTVGSRRPVSRPKLGPVGRGRHSHQEATPVRLTRRGTVVMRLAAVAATALIGFGLWQGFHPITPEIVGMQTVTVLPGQSVWAIAESANPGVDPRITVGLIEDVNDLESTALVRPGAELAVPVFATDG